MTIAEALQKADIAAIDGEVLLSHVLQQSRTWIIAHHDNALDVQAFTQFQNLAERRQRGEPVAYITGQKEFYGRLFHVTPATLIPRPATEELVRITLTALDGQHIDHVTEIDTGIVVWSHTTSDLHDVRSIIDVGTGSGCIAVTLACERPNLQIIATDISTDAIAVAQDNARSHNVIDHVTFRIGAGLAGAEPITEPFLLVSNPPYIPHDVQLERDVADFEPSSALFAGPKGTDVLYPLIDEATKHPLCRGWIVECRADQVRA